jgi:membrane dipeptidase
MEQTTGLTDFGKTIINEMNRLGMMVDLSHVSDSTMHATLDVAVSPVMFSHSSARGLCDVTRNVDDSILRRVQENGGVVMLNFLNGAEEIMVLK